jgi:hypothetical protein
VILSGVEARAPRRDMAGRAVFLDLPPIPSAQRRSEKEFWMSFRTDYPRLLGALLDAVVEALRSEPLLGPPNAPRATTLGRWKESLDRGPGRTPVPFPSRPASKPPEADVPPLDDSAPGNALLQIAPEWRSGRPPLASWTKRPRKTWPKRPPPWPTRQKPVHRNAFWSPPPPAITKKNKPSR